MKNLPSLSQQRRYKTAETEWLWKPASGMRKRKEMGWLAGLEPVLAFAR
jgi:hypothetical protein